MSVAIPPSMPEGWSLPPASEEPPLQFGCHPISADEWSQAKLAPKCIVENYLYADVGIMIAAGGIGKTTLNLFEAVHVCLGLPLYGNKVVTPGPVFILTAEDNREMLVARSREICRELGLSPEQLETVQQKLIIEYVGGIAFKLCSIEKDVVTLSPQIETVLDAMRKVQPVIFIIDPAVSFGVGEQRVNDAEQGLITACRKIRQEVECCVRLIHHTGKANAREKTVDQYSGRGGSAMADGARMVAVVNKVDPKDWTEIVGEDLADDEFGLRISRPKLSFVPPQADILVRRRGYAYTHVTDRATAGAAGSRLLTTEQTTELLDSIRKMWAAVPLDPMALPRKDAQSKSWVGYMVSDIAGLDPAPGLRVGELTPNQKRDRAIVKEFVNWLFNDGILVDRESPKDDKGKIFGCVDVGTIPGMVTVHSTAMAMAEQAAPPWTEES